MTRRTTPHALALAVAALLGAALCLPAPARAQRLQWNDDWPRFRPIGYALTGVSVAGALAVTFLIPYPDEPRWQGGILFDDDARDGLRARDPDARDAFRMASHFTLASTIVHVALVDSLIVPLADGSSDVAAQLTLMNTQAFALNTLIATVAFKVVARERPLIADCERDPDFDPLCDTGEYASFPSSHTSTAFTAAGLTCVHHQYLPIYGGIWDPTACAASLAVAFATGLFRILGDRHYTSDVIVGAAIGFGLGYLYPWLFHYQYGPSDPSAAPASTTLGGARLTLVPAGVPSAPYGLSLSGVF